MTNQVRFLSIGIELARKFFTKRSRGQQRNTEVHVNESELAALLALAAEKGADMPGTTVTKFLQRVETPVGLPGSLTRAIGEKMKP